MSHRNFMSNMHRFGARVVDLYVDGFRSMKSTGRTLWLLIILKAILLFAVMKLFFFPDLLATNYDTDAERAQAVRSSLTR